MSAHNAKRIEKPEYFGIRNLRMGRGKRATYVIGFDSEAHACLLIDKQLQERGEGRHKRCAESGYPFLYQFGHPDDRVDLVTVPRTGTPHETLYAFLDYLYQHTRKRGVEYVVFGYNLSYEFTQLFRDLDNETKNTDRFYIGDKLQNMPSVHVDMSYYIDVLNSKRFTFTIEWAKSHQRVKVIDGMAFVQGGLDAAGKLLGIGRKESKPPLFTRENANDDAMRAYAEQDARITQRLGEWVISLHEDKDVRTTISAPHFASSVFRRAYLDGEIALPDDDLEQAGLEAYHGGKNGFYLSKPTIAKDVYHVDIRSAYPEAMRQLPDPELSTWTYRPEYVPNAHAVWQIIGRYKRCKYRGLMGLDDWPISGVISTTTTGYELDEALRRGELELTSCHGWTMDGPSNTGALVRYVDDFYAMKRYAKTDTEKLYAKLQLNSLYGKFFQKVELGTVGSIELGTNRHILTDPEQDYDYRAGGLYHPPIAALITGYVRAKIHRLEHDFDSLMTSTDGIFSRKSPPDYMLGKELGQLSMEHGSLQIWRERLYIFTPDVPEHGDDCEADCSDTHPVYAMHGFQGKLADLRLVPMTPGNLYHYQMQHMVTLRQSTQALGGVRYAPGEFVMQDRQLQLPGRAPP